MALRVRKQLPLLGTILLATGSQVAWGQTVILTPSLTISEEYDDNVWLSFTKPQSDFLTAIRPGLQLELKDHPWYLTLAGSLRGEVFAKQTELNNYADNREGSARVEFRPTPLVTLSLADTFIRSLNAADAHPQTGLTTGRAAATSNTVTPAVRYQVTPLTLLGLQYSFNTLRSDSAVAHDSDTHEAEFSLQRQLTPRYSATFRYTFSHFEVEGSPE